MSDTQIYVWRETREKLEILAKRSRRTLAATVDVLIDEALERLYAELALTPEQQDIAVSQDAQ